MIEHVRCKKCGNYGAHIHYASSLDKLKHICIRCGYYWFGPTKEQKLESSDD